MSCNVECQHIGKFDARVSLHSMATAAFNSDLSTIPNSATTTAPTMSKNLTEQHQSVYDAAKGPILVYGILTAGYICSLPGKWIWFSWHPLAMTVSFIVLAANAALIKRIGGYNNTKLHGYLMITATVLSLFGWYVIYTNKEMNKKQHLTTYHAQLGIVVILGYVGLGFAGAVALDPQWGILKTNKTFRTLHKFAGRFLTATAWLVCVLGKNKM